MIAFRSISEVYKYSAISNWHRPESLRQLLESNWVLSLGFLLCVSVYSYFIYLLMLRSHSAIYKKK